MLVVQFRIADLYHPSTMPLFLTSVYSPIREHKRGVRHHRVEYDPISEPSTRQVPVMPPRYLQQRANCKFKHENARLGRNTWGGHDPLTIPVKSSEFAHWAVGILGVRRHRDKGVFGSFLDKTSLEVNLDVGTGDSQQRVCRPV